MNGQRSVSATDGAVGTAKSIDKEDRSLGVGDALAIKAIDEVIEVYVNWGSDPVNVVSRNRYGTGETWTTVSVRLRERVAKAIKPLTDAGWRMDGSPVETTRWDTTQDSYGQHYDGCWVRMRSRGA